MCCSLTLTFYAFSLLPLLFHLFSSNSFQYFFLFNTCGGCFWLAIRLRMCMFDKYAFTAYCINRNSRSLDFSAQNIPTYSSQFAQLQTIIQLDKKKTTKTTNKKIRWKKNHNEGYKSWLITYNIIHMYWRGYCCIYRPSFFVFSSTLLLNTHSFCADGNGFRYQKLVKVQNCIYFFSISPD